MAIVTRDGIMVRVERFLALCQEMLDDHFQTRFPTLPKPTVKIAGGAKYLKIILEENGGSYNRPAISQRVFAFIDMTNGDLLKPEGWKKPAKHARGNIFDDDYAMRNVGPYGIAYMDTQRNLLKPLGK